MVDSKTSKRTTEVKHCKICTFQPGNGVQIQKLSGVQAKMRRPENSILEINNYVVFWSYKIDRE